jgi:hypothetical protein
MGVSCAVDDRCGVLFVVGGGVPSGDQREEDMNRKRILMIGVLVLTVGLMVAGQASARPLTKSPVVTGTPDLVQRWMQRQTPAAPDLIERYVSRQPAASFYSAAALQAWGQRMQTMAQSEAQVSASSTSSGFDTRDALVGAGVGLGLVVCAAGLVVAIGRTRRPQVAL